MTQASLVAMAILAGGGIVLVLAGRWLPARWSAWAALGVAVVAFLPFLFLRSGPPEVTLFGWIPANGWTIMAAYHFDALANVFTLLAGLSALLLLLWMALGAPAEEGHFSPWVLLLLALFLNLLGSANLLLTYAAWEVLLLATYGLLIFRRAALPTPGVAEWLLGVQHLSGYLLLFALLLIGQQAGTLEYAHLGVWAVTPVALLLLLGTVWVRMALVPFQGWVMAAAEAPGPVSTLLLGSWILLAGPILWLRFQAWAGGPSLHEVAIIAGCVSLVVGAVLALRQESARRVQAGDTVSRLGLMWMALGLNGPLGMAAALFLILDFLLSKVLFHIALSSGKALEHPVRQVLFALGMWEAVGLPPSLGFVGRWLLVLGLIQAGRPVYLVFILLSIPLALAYLWRGWNLLPRGPAMALPWGLVAQRAMAVVAILLPLAGLAAPALWQMLFEPVGGAVLDGPGAVRSFLDALLVWAPAWGLLLLLVGAGGAWWSGALSKRAAAPAVAAASPAEGPLREPLPFLPRETAWLAWIGWPAPLYRLFALGAGRIVAAIQSLVTFLERHTTYFLLVVLVAATVVVIVLTR